MGGRAIAMWSGPRNISTAMMRAWENRPDTDVVDEPLYAHYLHATGMDHPGRDAVLASQSRDWQEVVAALVAPVPEGRVFYQKHMTHHLTPEVGLDWLEAIDHAFLIRAPERVVRSYTKVRGQATPADLGFEQQLRVFEEVRRRSGRVPPVVDAADVLADPAGVLGALCTALGLPFTPRMLHWPAGPRASDGVWAEHWYAAVWASTGFARDRVPTDPLDDAQRAIAEACRPYYEALRVHALR